MTNQEAYDVTILKWEFIAEGNFTCTRKATSMLFKEYPLLRTFRNACGYCDQFMIDKEGILPFCTNCPLYKLTNKQCSASRAPFNNWINNPRKNTAQKVLNAIKTSKKYLLKS